ncbi:MAG: hypothetical protein AB1442_12920 [Nitrospirota bacterium]
MKRINKIRNIPKDREAEVLHSSKRRCALCFAYNLDRDIKKGQITHIDRNPENNEPSNLAYLCLLHHDEYDGKTSQSKGWTPKELIKSKKELVEFIKNYFDKLSPEFETATMNKDSAVGRQTKHEKRQNITPDIYNLRIPIYNAYRDLIAKILRDAKIELQDLFEFANKTHEALFLYDENIADFFSLIFQKANRLHYLKKLMETPHLVEKEKWNSIVEEESDLLQWFHDNFQDARKLFKKYLNFG